MGLLNRLGLNFDTSRFGSGQNLSGGAANTLNLITTSSGGGLPTWQQNDLAAGTINRSNYFQNPTSIYIGSMMSSANILSVAAATANDSVTAAFASNLMVELTSFQSHTDNISGVAVVTNTTYPSFQSAQNIGQLNMMTLAKSDGVSNTSSILGSYTSLFITDMLTANANVILRYSNEYANSVANISGNIVSNLANSEVINIQNYLANTQVLLNTRRNGDWTFYRNSVQLAQDVGYMQQFNGVGGTASFLLANVVGTPRLLSNISSSIVTTVGASGSVPASSTQTQSSYQSAITTLGTVTAGIWNAATISTQYGGTGMTSFTSGGAVYALNANTLTTGVLPAASGGTGVTSSTGSGSVVLNTAPTLVSAILLNPTLNGNSTIVNITSSNVKSNTINSSNIFTSNTVSTNVYATNINTANTVSTNISSTLLNSTTITSNNIGVNNTSPAYPIDAKATTGEIAIQSSSSYASNYAWMRIVNTNNPSNPVDYGVSNDGSGRIIVRSTPTTGSRAFSINYGPLGDVIYSDTSGRISKPYQPSYQTYETGSLSTPSLTKTVYTGTAIHNVGNCFAANGRFTAPIAGIYHFWFCVTPSTGGGAPAVYFRVNGGTTRYGLGLAYNVTYNGFTAVANIQLNVNDYVENIIEEWNNSSLTIWSAQSGGYLLG